jgi:hypothetical protein
MRKYSIFLSLLTISFASFGQKKKMWGFVLDSASKEPIENASITNIDKSITSVSNAKGRFSIEVSTNQILSVASINHHFDTLLLTDKLIQQDTLIVYLKSISKSLKEVTVTAILNRYKEDSSARRKEFLEDIGSNKIPTLSKANSGAGVGINLDRFSKREKNKRRAYDLYEMLEQEEYINYRFNKYLVSRYTTMQDDELSNFMQLHRPKYQWLRKHTTDEDLKYYINEQLKIYYKRK